MKNNLSEQYWSKIYEPENIDIFDNPICNKCRKENLDKNHHMVNPVFLNYTSRNFLSNDYKILFIGKESYGDHEKHKNEVFENHA